MVSYFFYVSKWSKKLKKTIRTWHLISAGDSGRELKNVGNPLKWSNYGREKFIIRRQNSDLIVWKSEPKFQNQRGKHTNLQIMGEGVGPPQRQCGGPKNKKNIKHIKISRE